MLRLKAAVSGLFLGLVVSFSCHAAQNTPAQPADKSASGQQPQLTYTPWTKACTQDATANGQRVCFTVSTGSIESGKIVVAAVMVQRDGENTRTLRAVLPLGMQVVHGTRVIVDANPPVLQPYASCSATGCASDYQADDRMMSQLRTGKKLVVQAINSNGAALTLPVPLGEFARAFDAAPKDWGTLDEKVASLLQDLLRSRADTGPLTVATHAPWTKICLRGQDANAKLVCFTGKDGRTESGVPVVAAVLIETEAEPKKILRVTLPLGIQLASGTRLTIDSGAPLTAPFVICFTGGCMSDYDATPELVANLNKGNTLTVEAINPAGTRLTLPLPLVEADGGFTKALTGPPTDSKVFEEQEKKLREKLQEEFQAKARTAANGTSAAAIASVPTVVAKAADPQFATIPAPFGQRIALVIGNSNYTNVAALPNPQRDAAAVAEALRKIGFQSVELKINLNRDQFIDALRAFATRAESADWAIVYYAGHGMEVAGTNYLLPVDARVKTDRDVNLEAVSIDQVLSSAERARKLRLVLLDACRDNPFADQMKRTMTFASRSVTRGLAPVEPDPGTLVVFAAKHGEVALDGDGANSPFATAFLKNLQTPNLEIRRLFDNVRDDVMDLTDRRQQPFSYGSVPGRQDFYFTAAK